MQGIAEPNAEALANLMQVQGQTLVRTLGQMLVQDQHVQAQEQQPQAQGQKPKPPAAGAAVAQVQVGEVLI